MKKQHFYSLKRIQYIYHGDWSDPEVIYHKKSYNYYDIENILYSDFIDLLNNGLNNNYNFIEWIEKNKSYCYNLLDEYLESIPEYGG